MKPQDFIDSIKSQMELFPEMADKDMVFVIRHKRDCKKRGDVRARFYTDLQWNGLGFNSIITGVEPKVLSMEFKVV